MFFNGWRMNVKLILSLSTMLMQKRKNPIKYRNIDSPQVNKEKKRFNLMSREMEGYKEEEVKQ